MIECRLGCVKVTKSKITSGEELSRACSEFGHALARSDHYPQMSVF